MSDQNKSLGFDLNVLNEAKRMKDEGANNTQLRAYLEEHGMKDIVFDNDDVGINPGTLSTQSQAILANLEASNAHNAGIGPRGTISFMDKPLSAAFRKDIHLSTPVEELKRLTTAFDIEAYDSIIPPGDVYEQGKKGMAKFMNDMTEARRKYKAVIIAINDELNQGPLAGLVSVTGFYRDNDPTIVVGATFTLKIKPRRTKSGMELPSFAAMNRTRAYETYFTNLRRKYVRQLEQNKEA